MVSCQTFHVFVIYYIGQTFGMCVQLMFQGYVVCPSEKRFLLLFTFLRKNRNKKVMVFFSSCLEVKYFNELLNYIDIPVTCIHVSMFCLLFFYIVSSFDSLTLRFARICLCRLISILMMYFVMITHT